MKINTTQTRRLNKKGMTLIEISLVVALLLSLIAILFIGIAAYKRGADRSKCVMNISAVQKAVRSYQNMFEVAEGLPCVAATVLWPPAPAQGYFPGPLSCPTLTPVPGAYNTTGTIPPVSTLYMTCTLAPAPTQHSPGDGTPAAYVGW